ncbi:SusC/RagA family TonB-linked outer membrane protein [Rhabdobacter roseus]|uniref:TonB-linked SusC/RagA family outer membrane protein n=1 Tax=Rhabdobacter roseus TaxID=1655419 RepID=A0A840TMG3_9BACT|nr:SusC/RagA family TonB-linked outer membrane protein [Rhabdobacter roseus]MBB5284584.1 TonB-linked SusC/RagA family outer membrane protein [Rhabdobacter roseus]
MRTLLRRRGAWLLLSLVAVWHPAAHGQELWARHNTRTETTSEHAAQPQRKLLTDLLKDLEKQYKVHFAYQKKNLEGKRIEVPVERNQGIEARLKEILPPLNLTFEKVEKTYIIKEKSSAPAPETGLKEGTTKPEVAELVVKGRVTAKEDGAGLPGVNVILKGTQVGTSTDAEGKYAITVPDRESVLIFSFIGYNTQEIQVLDQSTINIELATDTKQLSEVIVTALGFRENKDKLGSTSSTIKADDIVRSGETGVINGLSGRAAGVQISRSTGDPGAGSNIQIRGQSTITGSNQPLIIIDGIPMSNNTIGDARSGVAQQSRLNDINPEDIASVQVLKGASAAGLWGSRAANGVIVITTKKGADDSKMNISYSSTVSFDKVNVLHPLQDGYGQGFNGIFNATSQYSWGDKIANRSGAEDALNMNGARFEAYNGKTFYPILTKNSQEVYHDARRDAVFRTGTYFDNNVSLSGGNDKGNFYLSLGNLDQKGIFNGQSDYKRSSVRFNTTRQFNDLVRASTNANYIRTSSNRIQKGDNTSGLYLGMLRSAPDFDSRYWIGSYYASPTASAVTNRQRSYRNYLGASANPSYNDPLWTINELTNLTEVERFIVSSELVLSPVNWFNLTARGGIDTYTDRRVTNNPVSSVVNSGAGQYEQQMIKETETNLDIIGRGMKDFGANVTSTLIVGFNVNDRTYHSLGGIMNNFILEEAPQNFTNSINANNYPYNRETHRRMARLYSTLNLGFYDQLYVNLSAAGEAGSTFGSESKSTFYYPSADVAWQFSQLPVFTGSALSFGKLRASYGIVGIQPEAYRNTTPYVTASFGSWATNLTGSGYGGAYVESTTQGDPYLKPERKTEWELGTDLRLLNNKLSAGFTYYQNRIVDLLLQVSAAGSTGFSQKYTNAGTMENKGMELDLNYNLLQKNNWRWNLFANWSRNRNRVIDLGGTEIVTFTGGALSTVASVGYPLSSFYGGVYKRNPDGSKVLTERGFPILDTQLQIIGDPNPSWRSGFGTNLAYKNISFNLLFETLQGGDFYEGTRGVLVNFGTYGDVGHEVTLSQDMYTYAGQLIPAGSTVRGNVADYGGGPVLLEQSFYTSIGGHSGQLAEQFVRDGSWTRVREISLGYSLNSSTFRQKTKLQSIDFTITGRNPFLWTKIVGIDPDSNVSGVGNARGVDYFNNPNTKSLVFSLRINY